MLIVKSALRQECCGQHRTPVAFHFTSRYWGSTRISQKACCARSASGREGRCLTTSPVCLFGSAPKSTATGTAFYICVDCGYIYTGPDFSKEPNSYVCPACNATKKRFKRYKGADVRGRPNNSNTECLKRLKEKKW